jgi:predicted permease
MSILQNAVQDLRFGMRSLAGNPATAAIAVLSLALGIGANTAILSLIDTVLVKSLPVDRPQDLVLLSDPSAEGVGIGSASGERGLFSFQEFQHICDGQQVFQGMFAAQSSAERVNATIDGGAPENLVARLVTGSYFSVLGIRAIVGRTFTAADDRVERNAPIAVISHRYWTTRFGASPGVLGRIVRIRNASLSIIGVAPSGFFGETVGDAPDVWIPMMMQPAAMPGREWLHDDENAVERVMWLHVMGRLKPGVTLKQAQANIGVVWQQLLDSYRVPGLTAEQHKNQLDQRVKLSPAARGASHLREDFSEPLYVLMAVVGMVLLIACANIANLLLARAAARQKEIAVRLAIGAGRGRLIVQFLTESLLLSAMGGVAAAPLAAWGTRILLRVVSSGPQTLPLEIHSDPRVVGFTAALAILTGILFGLAPALQATRVNVGPILKDSARGVSSSGSRVSLGKTLVVAQIAVSLLLLIGAGLFLRTLGNLHRVDLGYPREKLLLVDIDALSAGYKDRAASDMFLRLLDEIRSIPGVRSVTFSQNGLFTGGESGTRLAVEGYTPPPGARTATRFDQVGPGYFSALGIPILRGREIDRRDTASSTPVCVINQAMAKDFFDRREPLGQHLRDLFPGSTAPPCEIVGVVADARDHTLRGSIPRRFYAAATQGVGEIPPAVNFEIRTFAEPGSVAAALRQRLRAFDASLAMPDPQTLDSLIDQLLNQERVVAQLSAFFGGTALLLAAVGLYGVLAYAVERRTHEIGIRMAIGARRRTVVWLILRETLALLAMGVVLGTGAAMGLARLVASRMYGVATSDPDTIVVAVATLAVVAVAAACFPAMRAARVDPMVALRTE